MARPRAVTFDFHDTIAIAPAWFALEVRQLPGMVLHTLASQGVIAHDGALMERATAPYRALRQQIEQHGRESDALVGVQHALHTVGVDLPDNVVSDAVDELMISARADARPRPGIIEAVRAIGAEGVPLAVISNAVYHPFLEWCLDDWGLAEAFTSVISSAACGYYKSHHGIYRCALENLGVQPHETVHIGDSYRFDVESPNALGLRTVWLNLTGETREQCVADHITANLDGIAHHILNLA
jgi:FMN phosphatase YigB (HAD superfamily)